MAHAQMTENKGKTGAGTRGNVSRVPLNVPEIGRYLEISREETDRRGELDATIVEGVDPKWHVVEVGPGQEFSTAERLADRRFGTFVPSFIVETKDRYGNLRARRLRLFHGYVFIFVWDIEKHWTRITSCKGVIQILKDGNDAAKVPDEMIAHLRIREVYEQEKLEDAKPKKRKRRKKKVYVEELEGQVKIQPVRWTFKGGEWLNDIETLDGENRRAVFLRALGIEASPGSSR
jgi:transcription antitermination factor NusG